ncbi:MAG: NAD(+) diphosphatase [Acidimicrobiia bacterium]|nr:NAD(+) diphosphatase [Acidimicrobiia bacterium]
MNEWIAGTVPTSSDGPPSTRRWWLVQGASVLVATDGTLPVEAPPGDGEPHYLGRLGDEEQWALDVDAVELVGDHDALQPTDLFTLHATLGEQGWAIAGRAVQLVEWARTHRFCGRCGAATQAMDGERARRCPECGLMAFPRLAPAMIVLVERGEEVLLARGRAFPTPMYSCLAGFVEPGETVEEAVVREVREEVGVQVGDVRYQRSQPWPFPHSLMLGFRATWLGGDIEIDPVEIVDAQWYRVDDLPQVPPGISIARKLIDAWVAEHS